MKTLIIGGGCIEISFVESYVKENEFDYIIGVDGGCKVALDLGINMNYAVGDFDTLTEQDYNRIADQTSIVKLNPVKDETDMESAIEMSIDIGSSQVYVVGAIGNRIDHSLANIHLLYKFLNRNVEGFLVDKKNKIYMIQKYRRVYKKDLYGTYISFLPYTTGIKNLTLKGFKYPLNDANMSLFEAQSWGISNELEQEVGEIFLDDGILLAMETSD